ncbi:MAG TPA: o-succinylbenzoate synthase [Cyanothece sp. UBA12306]|nr:o-succinylbenzoate synthase [Cyanothece sp. UBA12306]
MSQYRFDFRVYSRLFKQPLLTHYGIWKQREGIIIRLISEDHKISWGEIAPLPWFGSENMQQALVFCQALSGKISWEQIQAIPNSLPACQFGFESALEGFNLSLFQSILNPINQNTKKINYSYLLPTGKAALEAWKKFDPQQGTTFKWKIGIDNIFEEIRIFEDLITELPPGIRLRLDGNGGLNLEEARLWLKIADQSRIVEFIEQPLSMAEFDSMVQLSEEYHTPLALDESVSNLTQLEQCYHQGWRGIFIIKAAIAGFPSRLRQLCRIYPLDLVFSSVFETKIAREYILTLVAELVQSDRAMGLGIDHWFKDNETEFLSKIWKNS